MFFHLLVSRIYDHDNPRSSFTLTICLNYEAFFRFLKFLTIFRFQYFFLGCISKGCWLRAKIMIFFKIFRFSLFSLGGIFSFLGFFAFKNMKKMLFLIALLKNFLMRKQQNRIFHASKNAETLLSKPLSEEFFLS